MPILANCWPVETGGLHFGMCPIGTELRLEGVAIAFLVDLQTVVSLQQVMTMDKYGFSLQLAIRIGTNRLVVPKYLALTSTPIPNIF